MELLLLLIITILVISIKYIPYLDLAAFLLALQRLPTLVLQLAATLWPYYTDGDIVGR
jgi:hypothetical protein